MAQQRCYYDVLNVERTATKVVIDRAYRKLAIKYHPDSNGGDEEAIAKFKECSEAYEVLSDSNKRARYDQFGHAGAGPGADGASPFGGVDDLFDVVSDIFGGGFGGAGGGGRRRRRVRKGNDVRSNVTLTLEEAASGATKEVSFRRRMPCDRCDGSGAAPGSDPVKCSTCGGHGQVIQQAGILRMQTTCPSCGGAGSVVENPCGHCAGSGLDSERVTLSIDIPAGVDDGMRVLASGEGEPSPDGDGPPGDCYCFVTVRPHSLFEREGTNLILRMPISYPQAALGAEIQVPTLNGPHTMKVNAGTQSGELFRVRGQGVPDHRNGIKGDLVVQVYIEVPKRLDADQERILRQLAELEESNVLPERKSFLEKLTNFFGGESSADSEPTS